MALMIALVGEQPLPNFLLARHEHPDALLLVYTESEEKHNQVFRYEWKQQQLQFKDSKMLPECVQLKDFFNVQLGSRKWTLKKLDNQPGSIFQKAVADTLQAYGYEVMLGVQAMQGQVDIDVAIRFKNQFGIIETKSGKKGGELEGIQQLSTAKRHLGTFTQQFYVITVPPTPVHKEIVDAANIQVISLLEYRYGATSLSLGDTKELIKQVDEALKE